MSTLTPEQQQYIVRELACFVRPTKIIEKLREEFAITTVSRSQISYYDPTNLQGSKELSSDLQTLFWQVRARFLSDQERIGVTQKIRRFQIYDEMFDDPLVQRSVMLQLQILKQVAQELGGMFEAKITEGEVDQYLTEIGDALKTAVETNVTDPAERDRICAEIQKILEEKG